MKKNKNKKERKRIKMLSYIWPSNLKRDLKEIDVDLKASDYAFSVMAYLVTATLGAMLFRLQPIFAIAFVLCGIYCVPIVLYYFYENRYERNKFVEENVYMEQILLAFKKNKRIVTSLEEVMEQMQEGHFRQLLANAVKYIYSNTDDPAVEENALKMIEDKHDVGRIKTIHSFMLKAEEVGGSFDTAIDLLLEDRDAYDRRINDLQMQKRNRINLVIGSIIISVILCILFINLANVYISIAHNAFVQIGAVVLWVIDTFFFARAYAELSGSWSKEKTTSEDASLRLYERIKNFDFVAEKATSAKYTVIAAVITGVVFALGWKWVACKWIALFLAGGTLMMPFQHKIDYSLGKKALIKEVQIQFPRWLMNVSMLLQTNSVEVALQESFEDAPAMLKPELNKLYKGILENPKSNEPYINFLGFLGMPSVTSSMQMLYALSAGTGGDANEQIAEIVRKNNGMLDKSEQMAGEGALAHLVALFMAPVISSSLKLGIDMIAFFYAAMLSMGSLVQ